MVAALVPGHRPGTDQPNVTATVRERHYEKPPLKGLAHDDRAPLADRVIGIIVNPRERVQEDRRGFFEGDTVPPEIGRGLRSVPLMCGASHSGTLPQRFATAGPFRLFTGPGTSR